MLLISLMLISIIFIVKHKLPRFKAIHCIKPDSKDFRAYIT